jgi:hypothetical protein
VQPLQEGRDLDVGPSYDPQIATPRLTLLFHSAVAKERVWRTLSGRAAVLQTHEMLIER